jgi:glyoxylate carboligase
VARARSVADQLVGQLVAAGVRHIYGIVGDSLNPVVDAVRRTEGIEWVQVRHEEAGAFAAAAEAELTGTLAGARGRAVPATCTSSMACTTRTVHGSPFWRSPRTSRASRSARSTSRRRTPIGSSPSARCTPR